LLTLCFVLCKIKIKGAKVLFWGVCGCGGVRACAVCVGVVVCVRVRVRGWWWWCGGVGV